MRIRTASIHLKFGLILLLTIGLTVLAGFVAAYKLRTILLRNTAQAVAEQVIAFRSWVSGSGMVWVNDLKPDAPDFLSRTNCGGASFYSKNPALATRELSNIVARSGVHAAFRVTSDNYRNAQNLPDPYEMTAIHTFKTDLAKQPKDQARFVEAYTGDRYRYSIPIKITETCLRCHGSPSEAPKEIREKYGDQRAFYYQLGDIRGVITVSLPALSLFKASPLMNVLSLALFAAACIINFVLLKKSIIDRISVMTDLTDRMAKGDLTTDLADHYRRNSSDEIDRLYAALELMRKNAQNAAEKAKDHS